MSTDVGGRQRRSHRRRRLTVLIVLVAGAAGIVSLIHRPGRLSAADIARLDIAKAAAISPLRGRIVALAEGQVGYKTSPANTYCNKFSAYWVSGTNDCGNGNLDEEWCADFAAWVWETAGANVTYRYISGDLNASSASFYEWGVARGTWHAIGSGYVPQPGDVAVYGLDVATLFAQHDAVVVGTTPGNRGPDAVNGDGDRMGFSVVEIGNDEYKADISGKKFAFLSGYVSPA